METSPEAFNILERIVVEKIHDGRTAKFVPKASVRRLSLSAAEIRPYFTGATDRPGYPMSKLLAAEGETDWTSSFKLDPLAEDDAEVMVLDLPHYSKLPENGRSEILFSFTAPIADGKGGNLLYGVADQGFLWAHGFLCRFEGSFEKPVNMDFLRVWRS